jgi:hypothetical protein
MPEQVVITDEQVAIAIRLWSAGESEIGVCIAIGVGVSTFRRLRRGQLKCLGRRPHASRNSGRRTADPTPEEILERAAECRRSWDLHENIGRQTNVVGEDSRIVRVADMRAALRNG